MLWGMHWDESGSRKREGEAHAISVLADKHGGVIVKWVVELRPI